MTTTLQRFFTVDALMERWGVTRETIIAHVRSGRLGCVDLSKTGIKREGKGPRHIGFTEAHIVEFEASRSVRFDEESKPALTPIGMNEWDGVNRLRDIKKRVKKT